MSVLVADVQGTRRLLDAARAAGVRHFVYMSIAGCARSSRAPDLAGPEPMTAVQAARIWRDVRQIRKAVLPVPVFGELAAGFRAGYNTVPDRPRGTITWREWLVRNASPAHRAR